MMGLAVFGTLACNSKVANNRKGPAGPFLY